MNWIAVGPGIPNFRGIPPGTMPEIINTQLVGHKTVAMATLIAWQRSH